jgi:hypothetical protein
MPERNRGRGPRKKERKKAGSGGGARVYSPSDWRFAAPMMTLRGRLRVKTNTNYARRH